MKLRITGLDPKVTRLQLENLLEDYGEVRTLKLLKPVASDPPVVLAIVEMEREKEAQEVIDNLQGHQMGEGILHIEWSSDRVQIKNPKLVDPIIDDDDDDDEPDNELDMEFSEESDSDI